MPCYDPQARDDVEHNIRKVNELTAMLCTALTHIENLGELTNLPVPLQVWWDHHVTFDRGRGAR